MSFVTSVFVLLLLLPGQSFFAYKTNVGMCWPYTWICSEDVGAPKQNIEHLVYAIDLFHGLSMPVRVFAGAPNYPPGDTRRSGRHGRGSAQQEL